MMEWIQTNYMTIVEAIGGLIAFSTVITGFFHGEKAVGVKAVLLKVAHIFSAVAPRDAPGSLSVPLTTIDIKPREPTP